MKILVTGASGFLGSRIVERLLRRGSAVRAQIRQSTGQLSASSLASDALEPASGNLLSRKDCERLVAGVDLIVHAAAGTRGAAADMYLNSVVATRNLLDACGSRVPSVCLVSSFSVYNTHDLARGAVLDERSPTEVLGVEKGPYAFSKVKQEELFLDRQRSAGFAFTIVRPGVIYGPGGSAMSSRVGIQALGRFFRLGGSCLLPLSYVDNCAEAVVVAALQGRSGEVFNAVDDDLPTCAQFLVEYQRVIGKLKVVPVPYWATWLGVRYLKRYSSRTRGQIPAVLTPYIARSMYRPLRYSNQALKSAGWVQSVPTAEGLRMALKSVVDSRSS